MAGPDDIEKFWKWWRKAERRLDQALDEPDGRTTAIDEIRFRLSKVKLSGDVLHAPDGRHLIVGSAASDPERRLRAAHWVIAAPESERFAFATHHPAQPVARLMASTLSGNPPVPLAGLRFTHRWRSVDDRADVVAHVGVDLAPEPAARLAGSVLRSALGELEAESWLGDVTVSEVPLDGGVDLAQLLADLAPEIEARSEPHWETYRYEKPGAPPLTVLLRQPLQPARHPFLDTCLEIATDLISDDPAEPGRMRDQLLDGMPADILLVGALLPGPARQITVIYANGRSPSIALLRDRATMLGSEIRAAQDPSWERILRYQRLEG